MLIHKRRCPRIQQRVSRTERCGHQTP